MNVFSYDQHYIGTFHAPQELASAVGSMRLGVISGAALSFICLVPPLRGQTPSDTLRLTLSHAHRRAVEANPELQAARYDIDSARGESRQVGLLIRNNPQVDVLGGGIGTEGELSQEIEFAGQPFARRASGRAGVERASAEVVNSARLVLAEVDRAFYRLTAADRRTTLAEEVLTLNQRLSEFA